MSRRLSLQVDKNSVKILVDNSFDEGTGDFDVKLFQVRALAECLCCAAEQNARSHKDVLVKKNFHIRNASPHSDSVIFYI
jgi:hypothetical protein